MSRKFKRKCRFHYVRVFIQYFYRNKEEISPDSFGDADVVVFGGPREPFTVGEFKELKTWLTNGGRALIMIGEGEKSNINYLLEE
jgi:intraflagellar transport protein 52